MRFMIGIHLPLCEGHVMLMLDFEGSVLGDDLVNVIHPPFTQILILLLLPVFIATIAIIPIIAIIIIIIGVYTSERPLPRPENQREAKEKLEITIVDD